MYIFAGSYERFIFGYSANADCSEVGIHTLGREAGGLLAHGRCTLPLLPVQFHQAVSAAHAKLPM